MTQKETIVATIRKWSESGRDGLAPLKWVHETSGILNYRSFEVVVYELRRDGYIEGSAAKGLKIAESKPFQVSDARPSDEAPAVKLWTGSGFIDVPDPGAVMTREPDTTTTQSPPKSIESPQPKQSPKRVLANRTPTTEEAFRRLWDVPLPRSVRNELQDCKRSMQEKIAIIDQLLGID